MSVDHLSDGCLIFFIYFILFFLGGGWGCKSSIVLLSVYNLIQ